VLPVVRISRRGVDRVRTGHPWIYRSDVVDGGAAAAGDLIEIQTERGRPLGWAFWSTTSQIAIRFVSTDPGELPDERTWLTRRLRAAAAYRDTLAIDASAWRLVHGESDRLPGLVVDRYEDSTGVYLVIQTLTQATDRRLALIVDVLKELFEPAGILARNDPRVRQLEGLNESVEVVHGSVPERIRVREGAVLTDVSLSAGQKTGSFLDQRENHLAARHYARGRVLDAFTYNGGFALQMARHAGQVLAIDSSPAAVEATRGNAQINGFTNVEVREANVFDELREREIAGDRFGTIVLDPPAFARSRSAVDRALAGYKEINLRAIRLLEPGGHLITCSCSYNVAEDLFLGVLRDAAADARVETAIVEKRMQARDHPVLLFVPETYYLKCVILRRLA
jgi:23S rRNA (cytosine1962-C5)-methyltransferase